MTGDMVHEEPLREEWNQPAFWAGAIMLEILNRGNFINEAAAEAVDAHLARLARLREVYLFNPVTETHHAVSPDLLAEITAIAKRIVAG